MPLNVDRLLSLELKRVEALERVVKFHLVRSGGKMPKIRHFSLPSFVKTVFEVHEPQVREWGGWRFHGPVGVVEDKENMAMRVNALWTKVLNKMCLEAEFKDTKARQALGGGNVYLRYYDPRHSFETVLTAISDYSGGTAIRDQLLQHKVVPQDLKGPAGHKLFVAVLCGTSKCYGAHVRVGQSVSKATLSALEGVDDPHANVMREILTRFFSEFGGLSSTTPFAVTLSTAPSSFLRLGEYGEKSCYGNGGQWEVAKHSLSLTPSSFVGLFYRDKDAAKIEVTRSGKRLGGVAGRCWGFLSKDGLLVSNFYLLSSDTVKKPLLDLVPKLCKGEGQHSKDEETQALTNFSEIHERALLYCNGDRTVIHAVPGFAQHVRDVKEFLRNQARAGREGWVDPCCVREFREALLKALPHWGGQEKDRESSKERQEPGTFRYSLTNADGAPIVWRTIPMPLVAADDVDF